MEKDPVAWLTMMKRGPIQGFDKWADKVRTKQIYKPLLERIQSNVSHMLANIGKYKDLITNEKPMNRDRASRDLMNCNQNDETITMAQHWAMMNAQQTLLLEAVEIIRKKLMAHGIAISNLANKALNDKWEASCLVAELVKTIEKKEDPRYTGADEQKADQTARKPV